MFRRFARCAQAVVDVADGVGHLENGERAQGLSHGVVSGERPDAGGATDRDGDDEVLSVHVCGESVGILDLVCVGVEAAPVEDHSAVVRAIHVGVSAHTEALTDAGSEALSP